MTGAKGLDQDSDEGDGMKVHVFAGPTLGDEEIAGVVPGVRVHPPVAHGDLLELTADAADVVVIVDGYYHQRAAVRHKEILHLIDLGVRVVGCASMGALRAAELAACGMIGHGRVYEMYRDGEIDADDEVAIAHLTGDSFEARNVPLVNVRHAVAQAARSGVLTAQQAAAVVEAARCIHYTDRSWRNVQAYLGATGNDTAVPTLIGFLRAHPEHADLKRRDALETLTELAAIVAAAGPTKTLDDWQNPHVYGWLPEFAGHRPDGGALVSTAEMMRYQQVYSDDFPALWRRFVIEEARRGPGIRPESQDEAAIARDSLAAAGALGAVLSGDNRFLTHQERGELAEDEVLVRTLVRSYVPPRGLHDVVVRLPQSVPAEDLRGAIAEAREINARVLWRTRIRLVERLSSQRIVRPLEALWGVPAADEETLLACARDRGLSTVADAVAAVRPYFLRDNAQTQGSVTDRWGGA
jgi:hypothetical protein